MSDETTTPKPKPRRSPRATRARRTVKPPNTVNPGWLHDALAAASLKTLRDATDGRLNVGNIADDFVARIPGAEDGPEPAVLLSRIYAHMGHRVPLVKRIEKRLEGRNLSSGLGSDALALLAQLYLRNRDLVPHLAALAQEAFAKRDKTGGDSPATTTDDTPPPFYDGAPRGTGKASVTP